MFTFAWACICVGGPGEVLEGYRLGRRLRVPRGGVVGCHCVGALAGEVEVRRGGECGLEAGDPRDVCATKAYEVVVSLSIGAHDDDATEGGRSIRCT